MIHLERVANEIKEVGLYNLILQDVEAILNKKNPTKEEILNILKTNPEILEEYKQTNVEYNISNIHIRNIDIDSVENRCKKEGEEINNKLNLLREIEKYTLDFEHSLHLLLYFLLSFLCFFQFNILLFYWI